jgi:hypothetical protein
MKKSIALCLTAFSQVKGEATHRSELVSQLRYGEPVQILDAGKEWSLIETEHGYQGFVRTAHLQPVSPEHLPEFSGIVGKAAAAEAGFPYSIGAFQWASGILPGWRSVTIAKPIEDQLNFGESLAVLAGLFLHVPYVWGGKTQWGLDCSGLVQLVMNLCGYSFPRDAWQQAEAGEEVVFSAKEIQAKEGDLLYFGHEGKRIHHVGISLGGTRFIHASEWVRMNSLSEEDSDFAPDRLETFVKIKRLMPSGLVPLREAINELFLSQNK